MSAEQYDADYFLRGRETGKSLYEDYRWLPDLTIPMVVRMIGHCGIKPDDNVLDFGCARGYTVRALREMGYNAWGYDISRWALENADPSTKEYLIINGSTLWRHSFDWVIAKDVLEHVQDVRDVISSLLDIAGAGVFAVVPLGNLKSATAESGGQYVVPDYEKDVTHIHRLSLSCWVDMFLRPGWRVEAAYRVPGIKDNYARWEYGNGFITARRLV